jgi:hypothetical protein
MIFIPYTPTELAIRTIYNADILKSEIGALIRKGFDSAKTNIEALSFIKIARLHGFEEMAEEMKNDLRSELSENAA